MFQLDDRRVRSQRILEALRNGVPNREAARFLGTNQETIDRSFWQKLGFIQNAGREGKQVQGLLIKGDFGTGKSHLLDCLAARALDEKFVCSRVAVSRETPLSDLGKVYLAAIDGALIPGQRGGMIHEVTDHLKANTPQFREFHLWVNSPNSGIGRLFGATLFLYEKAQRDDVKEDIRNFWSGEKLPIQPIKQMLKQMNFPGWDTLQNIRVRDLPYQRFLFTARLIVAAGYGGWILMVDEVEQIGRYGFLQRAKSYAELARLLGKVSGHFYPGLLTVATITEDFDLHVLQQKHDLEELGAKLRTREGQDYTAIILASELMMRVIVDRSTPTLPKHPNETIRTNTHERIKETHGWAYQWDPPVVSDRATNGTMRDYVRRWIYEWDLKRLYPNEPIMIEQEDQGTGPTYDEDETTAEASEEGS